MAIPSPFVPRRAAPSRGSRNKIAASFSSRGDLAACCSAVMQSTNAGKSSTTKAQLFACYLQYLRRRIPTSLNLRFPKKCRGLPKYRYSLCRTQDDCGANYFAKLGLTTAPLPSLADVTPIQLERALAAPTYQ